MEDLSYILYLFVCKFTVSSTSVLRECKNVELSFSDVTSKTDLLRGTKKGTVYLTPYRVCLLSDHAGPVCLLEDNPFYSMRFNSGWHPINVALPPSTTLEYNSLILCKMFCVKHLFGIYHQDIT